MHTCAHAHTQETYGEVMTVKFREFRQKGGDYVTGSKHVNGAREWPPELYFLT